MLFTRLLVLVQMDKRGAGSQFRLEPVDLNELASRTIKGLSSWRIKENPPGVYKRRRLSFRATGLSSSGNFNIIDNGIKYTPEGGRVTIEYITRLNMVWSR